MRSLSLKRALLLGNLCAGRAEQSGFSAGKNACFPRRNASGAFTLVELMIVLAIIGILSSVIIASTSAARGKARDNRRITDMKEIQLGLALYYDVNKSYPAGSDISALSVLVSQRYLPAIPSDPAGGAYEYLPYNSNKNYCVGVTLEGAVPNDSASCTSKSSGSTANYKAQR
jgi:prepilin-type N-terminal cleavage/methylation domain-containing protein